MNFNLVISPNAQREIDDAFEYYVKFSKSAVINFDQQLEEVYQNLEINPFFQIRYKNLRAVPFKSLPFILLFTIDEQNKTVYIYSVFNTYQDTSKYPNP